MGNKKSSVQKQPKIGKAVVVNEIFGYLIYDPRKQTFADAFSEKEEMLLGS